MNQPEPQPFWIKALKIVAALCLGVLALGFGAMGACGVVAGGGSLLERLRSGPSRGTTGFEGITEFSGLISAVGGFALARLTVWGIVLLFQRRRSRDE